jgi:hypothetical protein
MKLQHLAAAATIGLTTLGTSVAPALASSDNYYTFKEHVGYVWVDVVNLYKNASGGVTASVLVNLPTCNNFSNLAGYINFSFVSEDGGYFNNYKYYVSGKEGRNNVNAFVNVPYDMSTNGRLYITDETFCQVF